MAARRALSAWFEIRASWVVRRVAAGCASPGDGGLAVLAECLCEGGAELLVVLLESADPVGCGLQAAQERGIGGSLPFRWRSGHGALVVPGAELLDLGSEVGLSVEPGPGDAGFAGDEVKADRPRVVRDPAERGDRPAPGLGGSLVGGSDQVLGIVRSHWPSRRDRLVHLRSGCR